MRCGSDFLSATYACDAGHASRSFVDLMHGTVGIFASIQDARHGAQAACAAVPSARLRILASGAGADEIDTLPVDDAEQPGMGAAVGGVVGTAVGAAAASLVAPPAGLAAVAGIAGGALVGLGGGAVAGDALEEALSAGVPRDEIVIYQEELRRGRSLVVAVVEDTEQADAARDAMAKAGAVSVDAAREDWHVGLRDVEPE
jgi:hypothetical protein